MRRVLMAGMLAATTLAGPALAADDETALSGLKSGKLAIDTNEGGGKGLLNRPNSIDETRQSHSKQGIKPQVILADRGPATRLVQTDMDKVKPEDRAGAKQIAA